MTSEESVLDPRQLSRAESKEWRRFWKIVFFATLLPFLILLAFLEALGWSIGETYTPDALVRKLNERPDLIWMGVRVQAHARLKLAQVAAARPDVLVMGQSRFGQMRTSMFRPYTFYNLARVSWPLDTYPEILRHLPEGYRPKVIFINADFFMFGPEYTKYYHSLDMAPIYSHAISENLIQAHNVATELLRHPRLLWQRTDFTGAPARGISAILGEDGFHKDGSERTDSKAMDLAGSSAEYLMRPTWKEYITGGDKMGDAEMASFKEFVDLAREKGIPVIAVQMPIFGPALRMLEEDPGYRILQDFRDHAAHGYFDRLGVPFFDYSSFSPYSEDYRYFLDAVHPAAPLTEAVVEALGSDSRVHALLPQLDLDDLRRELLKDKGADRHILPIQ